LARAKKKSPRSASRKGFLALGSNLGDRRKNLRSAIDALRSHPGIRVTKESSFYDTEPAGGPDQGRFLNAVVQIRTTLEPEELLDAVLRIESDLGRVRREHWGPRTIDIDILTLEDLVYVSQALSIPHPLMHEREFVLRPLLEIAPDFKHPVFGTRGADLLNVCLDA
jgi:2-amino-4-hydroxy-6-hydroxymethyldihydropteridine diphosphokinase